MSRRRLEMSLVLDPDVSLHYVGELMLRDRMRVMII